MRSARDAIAAPRAARAARSALAAALAALSLACGGGRLDVPIPLAGTQAAPPPPLEAATLVIPVVISLDPVRAALEKQIPPFDSLDRASCSALGGAVCHQYVYRRDSIGVRMQGDRIQLLAGIRYRGRVAAPGVASLGSCGYDEPMRRAELRFSTALYWRSDWRLGSRGTLVSADLPDQCRITALRFDATPLMRRVVGAQLARVAAMADSAIPTIADLRAPAESLWRSLQAPVPTDSLATTWLTVNPETVGLVPLVGAGPVASTSIVVTARPQVLLGARPTVAIRPLPLLALARPAGGLHVPVRIELPFADLSRSVSAQLAAQTASGPARVTAAQVWAVGDTAVVKLEMQGSVNGALYLLGRFSYDSTRRQLAIADLRYSIASDDRLTRLKVTLGAPLVHRAIDEATGHGRMDVGAQLDSVRAELTRQLNRPLAPGAAVSGGIESVRVTGVYATATAFVVYVVLDGTAALTVR